MFPCSHTLSECFRTVIFRILFPCSQNLANVPLFPSIFCQCSLVPQNPWETLKRRAYHWNIRCFYGYRWAVRRVGAYKQGGWACNREFTVLVQTHQIGHFPFKFSIIIKCLIFGNKTPQCEKTLSFQTSVWSSQEDSSPVP